MNYRTVKRNSSLPSCHQSVCSSNSFRRGITMVEMLVAIAIIGILISLALPALQQARGTSRRTVCLNNLRNVNLAMMHVVEQTGRFPASGNFTEEFGRHHSWVVDLLPFLDQANVANQWNKDLSIYAAPNLELSKLTFPVLTCPEDGTLTGTGDLSYVVNGGVGFTIYHQGAHDCPVDAAGKRIDFNGNGIACSPADDTGTSPTDKELLFRMVLFFNETWDTEISRRHHKNSTILDGLSNTLVLSENVRTGHNPASPEDPWDASWASPSPKKTSFHIGDPCKNGECTTGNIDYNRANSGSFQINSGLEFAEGTSPIPNSYHPGGVNMGFADGRVKFVSEEIDGNIYAAITSPQGRFLQETLLSQVIVGGSEF